MFGLSVYWWAEVAVFSAVLWALHWYVRGLQNQFDRLYEISKRNAAEAKHWHQQALEAGSRCKALEKRCEELQSEPPQQPTGGEISKAMFAGYQSSVMNALGVKDQGFIVHGTGKGNING